MWTASGKGSTLLLKKNAGNGQDQNYQQDMEHSTECMHIGFLIFLRMAH